ncbi:hypothetical protein KZZ07_21185 [Mameliella sp. CS4]|uniref:hypothetical protein n=1 Tax=Mameliella sp. CS4 TaxID=2862329 RepID=UPI001C5FDC67|nr:hypothetical protein [Mameliella sp. CS4]MBW4985062.1 hypothetical protein [Mameliella sp. CS4]
MRIVLMHNPWGARALHTIEADTFHEWRISIAQIPARGHERYSAAIYLPHSGKPYPVQTFEGWGMPREVRSADGFLVVRTGLHGARLAHLQWAVLADFPRVLTSWLEQIDAMSSFASESIE